MYYVAPAHVKMLVHVYTYSNISIFLLIPCSEAEILLRFAFAYFDFLSNLPL